MSYDYQKERPRLFTKDGQADFVTVRDTCRKLLKEAGAFQTIKAGRDLKAYDTWQVMACLDLMVERGELCYVHGPGDGVHGQDWTYIAGPKWDGG